MACNIRKLFKCVQGLRKSTNKEVVEDRLYKLKDGTLNLTNRKDAPSQSESSFSGSEQSAINKPMHSKGLPMLPRQGNKTTQK